MIVPDWRKPEEYPDPEKTSLRQWAWEFLRRNKQYQEDYQQLKVKRLREINRNSLPELAQYAQFMVTYSIWPFCGVAPNPNLSKLEDDASNLLFDCQTVRVMIPESGLDHLHLLSEDWSTSEAGPEEIAIIFDISRPIRSQLQGAEYFLKSYIEKFSKKSPKQIIKQIRPRKENYKNYLRLLDAIDAGEQKRVIAMNLYPGNSYSDGESYPGQKKLSVNQKRAEKLRDEDYRFIPCLRK